MRSKAQRAWQGTQGRPDLPFQLHEGTREQVLLTLLPCRGGELQRSPEPLELELLGETPQSLGGCVLDALGHAYDDEAAVLPGRNEGVRRGGAADRARAGRLSNAAAGGHRRAAAAGSGTGRNPGRSMWRRFRRVVHRRHDGSPSGSSTGGITGSPPDRLPAA